MIGIIGGSGVYEITEKADSCNKKLVKTEAIIQSMTPYERQHPEVLKASRKQRIAKGSGTTVTDVNQLINQFEDMKKMMKMMSNGNFKLPF